MSPGDLAVVGDGEAVHLGHGEVGQAIRGGAGVEEPDDAGVGEVLDGALLSVEAGEDFARYLLQVRFAAGITRRLPLAASDLLPGDAEQVGQLLRVILLALQGRGDLPPERFPVAAPEAM